MTSDGHRLRESWSNALNDAVEAFRGHLTSGNSSSWKRVPFPAKQNSTASDVKGKQVFRPEPTDALVHRKSTRTGDIYRVLSEIPLDDDVADLEVWRAVLVTPELRQEWDPAVESSRVIEMFDPSTRIVKTKFTLGWPANPRDAVMISRTISDATTVIDISTSLPRSQDEPSYLRPAPPYVRSRVELFAWCIQLLPPTQPQAPRDDKQPSRQRPGDGRLRITCFWQHDLRTVWNIGAPSNLSQQLSETAIGLLETVKKRRTRVAVLSGYGHGISIERISFDIGREALTIEYDVIPEEEGSQFLQTHALHGLDELHILKEQRRLQRSLECVLPCPDGWDIRVATRASSQAVAQLPWTSRATRIQTSPFSGGETVTPRICFQIRHSPLLDDHSILKVKILIEYSGSLKGIRLDGLPHDVEDHDARDPISFSMSNELIQDASSAINASIHTGASIATVESDGSSMSSPRKPALLRQNSNMSRPPAADKSIQTLVRRNYIYFSSLLQEPEAKWRRNTEARGVSVTQLDSIDPTLVVYKAEATFVGVGLWDLYSTVVTPGARVHWDKQYDDAVLIEDVNELSELWYYRTKPAWPVAGRDVVVLKTVYKSPTTVHVFSFSVDDTKLFPNLPPGDPNLIRTQVDLQGWAIESLSPNTTLLTLLEQSDPKGWSGKSSIPQQMIGLVAGIGEFAIKCGGPPIVTRLGGAKAESLRYDHEKGTFRVQYEADASRRTDYPLQNRQNSVDGSLVQMPSSANAPIECELRCDIDTWATALDIVIDPPPQTISCLRRHRLSAGGGGLWLTVGHDIAFSAEERLRAIIRRAPFTTGKEKGFVMVNGKRITVDIEDLPEAEVKSLAKQKRVKPVRIPLDQPPVLGVIRRRRREHATESSEDPSGLEIGLKKSPTTTSTAPTYRSPLSTFFINAMEQARTATQQTVAALTPTSTAANEAGFSPNKAPMHYALDALAFVQGHHRGSFRDNWTPVVDKTMNIQRRLSPEISSTIHVHKGEKVIEGVTAEEVANVVFSYDCRRHWDDRFDSVTVFEEFGADCHTAFLVSKGGLAFRDRGFYLASLVARGTNIVNPLAAGVDGAQSPSGVPNAVYCISASFNPDSAASYSPAKYNSYGLPIGRMYLDAWILETLDPYTSENYEIPSIRCSRLVAADYAGSIPIAVNSMINSSLPRAVLAVETYLKGTSPFPEMRMPASGYNIAAYDSVNISGSAWTLIPSSKERILLASKLTSDSKIFQGNVIVSFIESPPNPTSTTDPVDAEDTPRIGVIDPPSRSPSPAAIRRPRTESSPVPRHIPRHRRISSTSSTMSPPNTMALRSRSRDALRSAASAFSIGKEFKLHFPADFVVAEVVVDLRLYPSGYDVQLKSEFVRIGSSCKPLPIVSMDQDDNDVQPESVEESEDSTKSETPTLLPFSPHVHLLPPSPLHTSSVSGSNPTSELPTRHLVRITLPTSQYLIPSVDDPLTGETRTAPPKPQWFRKLEEDGAAANLTIIIRPLPEKYRKKGRKVVRVDGMIANVLSGDGLRGHTPEESGLGLLSRVPADGSIDVLPKELTTAIAIADHLFDQVTRPNLPPVESGGKQISFGDDNTVLSESPRSVTPVPDKSSSDVPPPSGNTDTTSSGQGFFGLLNSYQNQLLRLASINTGTKSTEANADVQDKASTEGIPDSQLSDSRTQDSSGTAEKAGDNQAEVSATVTQPTSSLCRSLEPRRFTLSTLIAVALIAFLLGSLLRSLLSPADFIYVVRDLKEAEGIVPLNGGGGEERGKMPNAIETGWREIRRLLEVKYLVGGWDFQVAVVRRH